MPVLDGFLAGMSILQAAERTQKQAVTVSRADVGSSAVGGIKSAEPIGVTHAPISGAKTVLSKRNHPVVVNR